MLNVTSKSENETFLKLHEFVGLLKLESSRNVTSKVTSNRAKARKSKSTVYFITVIPFTDKHLFLIVLRF